MLPANTLKYLIYAGIILAFLAVPVGSYYLVKRANDKLAALQHEMTLVKAERDGYVAKLEFDDKMKESEKVIHEEHVIVVEEIEHLGKQVDDVIRLAPREESSKVLKDTVRMLKEQAK